MLSILSQILNSKLSYIVIAILIFMCGSYVGWRSGYAASDTLASVKYNRLEANHKAISNALADVTSKHTALISSVEAENRRIIDERNRLTKEMENVRRQYIKTKAELEKLTFDSRVTVNGMHDTIDALSKQLGELPAAAVREYAITAGESIRQCTDRYHEMAAELARCNQEVNALFQAWPK